jgi:hypothetical protein
MSNSLVDKIHHYASFPQTGVSLQVSPAGRGVESWEFEID